MKTHYSEKNSHQRQANKKIRLYTCAAGGAGLVDLHQSFLGKTALFLTVAFCLTVRRLEDLDTLEVLADEATFYDKQWNATWEGKERPSDNN